jgi:hypothetical protein
MPLERLGVKLRNDRPASFADNRGGALWRGSFPRHPTSTLPL